MTFHHGWLYIAQEDGDIVELFNHARTAGYLTNSTVLGCGTVHNVLDDGGCAAYPFVPSSRSNSLPELLTSVGQSPLTTTSGELITISDGPAGVSSPLPNVTDWTGYWSASQVSGLTMPNLSGGAAPAATISGLTMDTSGTRPALRNSPSQYSTVEKITFGVSSVFDLAADEDLIAVWVGTLETFVNPGGFAPMLLGFSSNPRWFMSGSSSLGAPYLYASVIDGAFTAAQTEAAQGLPTDERLCAIAVFSRAANASTFYVYGSDGRLINSTDGPTSGSIVGAIDATTELLAMYGVGGTCETLAFHKGVGIAPSANEIDAIARDFHAGWVRETYSAPSVDPAPWYSSSFPESGEALGFWVTEWTGLDSGHIQREVTQVGAYRGGGVMGALGSRSREMGFEIILLGESERALDYLFRWLDATLSSVCATCATDTILLRRFCPPDPIDGFSARNGVVEMRGVGLVSGLQWGAPPVEQAGCFIRRANFTLGATDPCMYGFCTDVAVSQTMDWEACVTAANMNPARAECRPSCSEMSGDCRTVFNYTINDPSGGAPIIELSPPLYLGATIPVRIRTYANPNGLLPDELCGAPLLGELYVTSLPEWTDLRYDVAGRRIEIRNAGTGGWINGFAYLEPNTVGVPRFFFAGCGDYTTIVEPADFCLDATLNTQMTADGRVTDVAFDSAGRAVVGGDFVNVNTSTVQNRIARFNTDGTVDTGFNTGGTVGVDAQVNDLAIQSDGKIVIGGAFIAARGTTQNRIARLNTDGSLDTGFNTGGTVGTSGDVNAVAVQSDGKIIVGGIFFTARGTTQNYIARLNTDGTLDTSFNTGGTVGMDSSVNAVAIQPDGKIVVGGSFTTARGTTQNYITRLNTDGTVDTGFNTGGTVGVDAAVNAVAIQSDGKIVIGGNFTTARGTTQNRIARLNTDGTLDTGFNTGGTIGVDGNILDVAIQSDGKIVISGAFAAARGTTQDRIARLNPDGTLDTEFNTGGTVGANNQIGALGIQSDRRIVIGGDFTAIRGVTRSRLAVLNPDGSLGVATAGAYLAQPDAALSTQTRMGCA